MIYNSAFARRYIDGGASNGWVSFSGIIFTTDATAQSALPLAAGWTSGSGWPGPTYAVAEGRAWGKICHRSQDSARHGRSPLEILELTGEIW